MRVPLLLRALLRLSPRWLRDSLGAEVLETSAARLERARKRGAAAWLALLFVEAGGLMLLALRARGLGAPQSAPAAASFHPLRPGSSHMDSLVADVRGALRSLVRRPATSLASALTFGLGIAAVAAMFSVVSAVLLEPLPFAQAEQLMNVFPTIPEFRRDPRLAGEADRASFSWREYQAWSTQQTSFGSVGAFGVRRPVVSVAGNAEQLRVGRATPSLFATLRVVPGAGRLLTDADNESAGRGVLVSDEFAKARWGAAAAAVGDDVRLNDVAYTVVGVLPPSFRLDGYEVPVWTALGGPAERISPTGMQLAGNHWLNVIGRLRPGATRERAAAELTRTLEAEQQGEHVAHGANIVPRASDVTRTVRMPLIILMSGALLLLLVACGSAATVAVSAAVDRESELTVRAALGASRGRLAAQVLTENLVLAFVGGSLGVVLALPLLRTLLALAPETLPRLDTINLNWRVLGFAFIATTLFGAVFALMPAWHATRMEEFGTLRTQRAVSRRRGHVQRALVVLEFAFAMVLLVSAGLLTRTMLALDAVDIGMQPERVAVIELAPIYSRFYFAGDTATAGKRAFEPYAAQIRAAMRALPGVDSEAMSMQMPYSGSAASTIAAPPGYVPAPDESMDVEWRVVTPSFFETLGIPIVRGRAFTEAENRAAAAHVVIITERLAHRFWPNQDPIGRTLVYWDREATVVGVAANVRDSDLTADPNQAFYLPFLQGPGGFGTIALRTSGDPRAVAAAARRRIAEIDPELPVVAAEPLTEWVAGTIAQQRFRARLMGAFAVLAGMLAVMSVYGVISRSVARRMREMGIRIALGAPGGSVLGLVISESLRLTLTGIACGLVVSLALMRLLQSMLFGVRVTDPLTYAAIALLLVGMAVLAALGPARRALRADPVLALRAE